MRKHFRALSGDVARDGPQGRPFRKTLGEGPASASHHKTHMRISTKFSNIPTQKQETYRECFCSVSVVAGLVMEACRVLERRQLIWDTAPEEARYQARTTDWGGRGVLEGYRKRLAVKRKVAYL